MIHTRLIPVLLIHQGGIYKTTKFKKPIYIGDPINTIRLLNEMEVDEIVILDIDASKQKKDPNYEMIMELASEAFMPVAYGGGLRTIEQAKKILNCGIEKIVINYAAQQSGELIKDCSRQFGSQSVVSSIDYSKSLIGGNRQYDHVTRKQLIKSPIEAAKIAQKMGAGEILLTSVDREGSMQGLDVELIHEVNQQLEIPLIICGGAGTLEHLKQAQKAGASAIAGGSMFIFRGNKRGILINYPNESLLRQYLN